MALSKSEIKKFEKLLDKNKITVIESDELFDLYSGCSVEQKLELGVI